MLKGPHVGRQLKRGRAGAALSGRGLLANFSGGGYLPGCVSWRALEVKLGATVFFAEYGNSSKWIRLTLCGVRFSSIWGRSKLVLW